MVKTVDEQIALWNHANVRLIDVRLGTLADGDAPHAYRLPAHAFLYAAEGGGIARLDEESHNFGMHRVLHGGRGAVLRLSPDEWLSYYIVLYKAEPLPHYARQFASRGVGADPFRQHYGMLPTSPLALADKLAAMREDWLSADPLDQLRARQLFGQFVHELLRQMRAQGVEPNRPDLVAQAVRFMDEHYSEPMTLARIAELFGCSESYLTKQFRRRLGLSPIRYLTQVRTDRAARMLGFPGASLQEIAERVGYPDAHSLSRSFKKRFGRSPAKYLAGLPSVVPELPDMRTEYALAPASDRCYIIVDNHSHERTTGGASMFRKKRASSMTAAALLLGITMLISACGTGNTNHAGGSSAAASASASPIASPQATAPAAASEATGTRTYVDSKGTVTIPVHPERIVDLTGSAIGNLLELGIKPIAATDASMQSPYHQEQLAGVVNLGEGSDFEKIISLQPDLIVAFDYLEAAIYDKLAEIAPVVRLAYGADRPAELLKKFGDFTGRADQAQAWIDEWNRKIERVKPKIVETVGDRTVSILQPFAKGIYAWGDKGGRGGEILYGDLGLKAPPIIKQKLIDGPEFGANLSLEQLPEYAGDYIFTSNWGWDDGDPEVVYGSALWKGLPAVKEGRTFFIDTAGSYYNDPISLDAQLAFIVESFLGNEGTALLS
ncbi:iron complex transport system substrate-binding protein [Cohnella sp. OV330]|uniref:AraC family transcriptional regulator n=1 Tax=Cohnella sp. OV330 TaxID=1855288 RepID=UPI0008ED4BFA|nr:AraC family transcriptional regulator [Cohnella sp. OV330]SFB50520.1 iron complex transport system substrate-binding protein [Cohnella sp. OV330]